MPVARRRAGLTAAEVVRVAADIADETGFANVTLGLVAERLGVRAPSLYKHVDGLADLQHRIATLAMTEFGDIARDAAAGLAGRDALAALANALRSYVSAHPGRYTATIGAEFTGPDDPLLKAGTRVIELIGAVLRGYRIDEAMIVHAIRSVRCTLHGWAALQAVNGFQWSGDLDVSFEALIDFMDTGLRGLANGDRGPEEALA
ncbi:MAG TPA: TetR/AcrR family transcriptional regulator [Trebonia sp.]|jgi:AcrR family transcriptional regulator